MPSVYPVIPESIVEHLGAPTAYAENVTVAFPDYIKNVVCSEIYPTWEESAIVANTLAIISFALNRVYTEYYPSRGYSFNITNSTAIDQKYIQGRSLFENVVQIVDEIFNSYLRYAGFIEPLAAKFCNGTTSTCDGLLRLFAVATRDSRGGHFRDEFRDHRQHVLQMRHLAARLARLDRLRIFPRKPEERLPL